MKVLKRVLVKIRSNIKKLLNELAQKSGSDFWLINQETVLNLIFKLYKSKNGC